MSGDVEGLQARARLKGALASLEPRFVWESGEAFIRALLFLAAAFAVIMAAAIALSLLGPTVAFFGQISFFDFFGGTIWSPDIPIGGRPQFGVLPLLVGTLLIAGASSAIGLPLGFGAAIYLREYAPSRLREVVKPALEVLAGIPTVVLGFFALLVIGPVLQDSFGASFFSGANAIVVIGIMIIPIVSSLSEDALTAVPTDLRDGALALGATRFEATTRVVVPAGLSGIGASFLLAFSRAVGETMVVLIAAGQHIRLHFNIFDQMTTMSGFIAKRATGDVPAGTILYDALYAVGFTLFVMTLLLNLASDQLRSRFREVYE
jgi:phosphate transport system permease protein